MIRKTKTAAHTLTAVLCAFVLLGCEGIQRLNGPPPPRVAEIVIRAPLGTDSNAVKAAWEAWARAAPIEYSLWRMEDEAAATAYEAWTLAAPVEHARIQEAMARGAPREEQAVYVKSMVNAAFLEWAAYEAAKLKLQEAAKDWSRAAPLAALAYQEARRKVSFGKFESALEIQEAAWQALERAAPAEFEAMVGTGKSGASEDAKRAAVLNLMRAAPAEWKRFVAAMDEYLTECRSISLTPELREQAGCL